jgi:hypothetical protein
MRTQVKRWVMVGLVGPVLFGGAACGTIGDKGYTFPVEFSQEIPAAQGRVEVVPDKSGSQKVELHAKHLPAPSSVKPEATAYVVWVKPQGANPQNVGILSVNADNEAKFTTKTAFSDFEILVTAEKASDVNAPSEARPVMRASVSRGQVY